MLAMLSLPNMLLGQDQVFYAGCQEADFLLIEADVVEVKIQGMKYEPKCLRVKAGTTVILPASKKHPLQGSADIDGLLNPLGGSELYESAQSIVLQDLGQMGYFCEKHGNGATGSGMAGLIEVTE